MTLQEIKSQLRSGPYAWPGGYPVYFVTSDGAALSVAAVRTAWRNVVSAHLANDKRCGWHIAGADINWEDASLFCEHTNERIESAYAEDDSH